MATTGSGEVVGWAAGSGERVLALHGGPGLSYDYLDPMVDELAACFEVATYQQRGLAPSSTSGPFHLDQEVRDALAVLDALGWDRALLAGHSWGGHLALHLAVRHPERVRAVLAVDPLGAVGDGGVAVMSERLDAYEAATADREADLGTRGGGLSRVWPAYFANPADAPPMPPLQSSREANEGIFDSVRTAMPALREQLSTCPVPIVCLAGGSSPLAPAASSAPTAEAALHGRLEVVELAGHFPWHERPGCVLDAMRSLVAELER